MAIDPLAIISQRESNNRNVRNYKYGPGFTASGYFQITNPTWQRWARAAGIDLSRYPTAESAPYDVQRRVAEHGYRAEGFKPWLATKDLVGQERSYPVAAAQAAGIDRQMPVSTDSDSTPTPKAAELAKNIADLRARLQAEFPNIRFTSGDRSPSYNAQVGGAKNSQHTHGTAVDIGLKEFDDATRQRIIDRAIALGARGIGYYPGSQSAHVDLRTGPVAAWGPNYSRTSLGQTPTWFQDRAKTLLAGGGAPAAAPTTQVAQAPGGLVDQNPTAPAEAQPSPERDLAEGIAGLLGGSLGPAPAAPPQEAPAPISTPEPAQPAVAGTDQGSAATLMASLIDRKRMDRGAMPVGLLDMTGFA